MFVFMAVALASCGGDDKDEPDNPSGSKVTLSMLIGVWTDNRSYTGDVILTFKANGEYTITGNERTYVPSQPLVPVEEIGTYTLKGDKLEFSYTYYWGDRYNSEGVRTMKVKYDTHIHKLIISYLAGDRGTSFEHGGQFTKIQN